MSLQIVGRVHRMLAMHRLPLITVKRSTTFDFARTMIGKREIVGYGWNGCPCYDDRVDYPFPAIRFREPSEEICQLRERENGDWNQLTLEEKKQLYRYSFCQTFAEFKAPTANWKLALGIGFWIVGLGILFSFSYYALGLYKDYPETFEEERRQAQLKRMIFLEVNPVTGLSSNWDYENKKWKSGGSVKRPGNDNENPNCKEPAKTK